MKKYFYFCLMLAIACMIGMSSCNGCSTSENKASSKEQVEKQAESQLKTAMDVIGTFYAVPDDTGGELVPEHVIAVNRQWMWMNQSKDYSWFETEVEYVKALSDTAQTGEIKQVRNVFQKVVQSGRGFDVTVWQTYTNKAGTVYRYVKDFWMEDYKLNEEPVKLTFKDAYDRLMEANIPKPNGHFCVLRMPVEPGSRPIYIFGNKCNGMVAVDASTGEVCAYLGAPLGEWP